MDDLELAKKFVRSMQDRGRSNVEIIELVSRATVVLRTPTKEEIDQSFKSWIERNS